MNKLICGTHNGIFHLDDLMCRAILEILNPGNISLVRTRNPDILHECSIVFDVGGVYDPDKNMFDHHFRNPPLRMCGIPYSAAGLLWKKYGRTTVGNLATPIDPTIMSLESQVEHVYDNIDRHIMMPIDAGDTGYDLALGYKGDTRPLTMAHFVNAYVPLWDEAQSEEAMTKGFEYAWPLVKTFLNRQVSYYWSGLQASQRVRDAFEKRSSPHIVLMLVGCPWQEALLAIPEANEVLYVVFQAVDGKWMCQGVPAELGSFTLRKPLPEHWAGLRDADFQKKTGVEDGIFCHPGRFICGADTKEGALRLAQIATES